MPFTINKTWDGEKLEYEVHVKILEKENDPSVFLVQVDAPYFGDPSVPSTVPSGSTPGLWDFEVVELFLNGENDQYLEIELGPQGHYLLLQLDGYRNCVKEGLQLENYRAKIDGKRWLGEAEIPLRYLPKNVHSMNAYAIHKSNQERVYMALFPAEKGRHSEPDFHRLQYFKKVQIPALLSNNDQGF